MPIGYCVTERCNPRTPAKWASFKKLNALPHVTEVVGMDCSLCPTVLDGLIDEDYAHLVFADHSFGVFDSPEYAVQRSPLHSGVQLLAVMREPTDADLRQELPAGFVLKGFDLMDEVTAISALTNCGGFPKAFSAGDISASGLIADRPHADVIRERLLQEYPYDAHAECMVWAIWRQES
jgi:hypothetical protein